MAPSLDSGGFRYEQFFQTTGDLLCVLDPTGRFVRANESFRQVLGYPESTLLGQSFATIVHRDDLAQVQALFAGDAAEDAALRSPLRLVHRDLSERTLSFSLRRVAAEGAIYGAGREVAEQESGAEAQRRAAVLMKMQSTALVGGWEVNCLTGALYWTDETYRIHEVPPGFEPKLETAIAFYAPEAVPVITACVEDCMKGKPYHVELQLITATGRRLWVRAAGQPVMEEGKAVRLIGAFQDIDDFKRREIELEEKLAIIEEQRTAIRTLSAPIIQVWDGVLALPVVGTLDEARAADITERMLDAVAAHRARYAILDLTGVETVDEGTASHLVKIIRAIQLLGAQSLVTGIRPAMAQTLIGLGAGFGGARTVSNLREAIKIAMRDDPASARSNAPAMSARGGR